MKVTVESTSEEEEEVEEVEQRETSQSLQGSLAAGSRCILVRDVGCFSGPNLLYGLANVSFFLYVQMASRWS